MDKPVKEKIIELVDKSWEPWRKAAFYSNPLVIEIMDKLYKEWEKEGRKGIPLDYASQEELEKLLQIALTVTEIKESDFIPEYYEEQDVYGTRSIKRKKLFRRKK
ncbi:MAG: hypothetical protein QXT88_02995 [Desulfurococcaceae archaeon]